MARRSQVDAEGDALSVAARTQLALGLGLMVVGLLLIALAWWLRRLG